MTKEEVKESFFFWSWYQAFPIQGWVLVALGDIYELTAVVELCLISEVYLAGKIKSKQTS